MMNALESTDPIELGERLRSARSRAGFTQQEAADRLGLARTTLVALEKGQRRIRLDELRQLAALYNVSVNALLRPQTVTASLVPRFRALPGTDQQQTDKAAVLLNDLAAASVELEALLGIPARPNYPPERALGSGDVREQAEDAAMEIRQRFGIGLSPIADIVTLLELEFGIRVFIKPLPSQVSGLFAFDRELGACILLNKNHPRERRAITAAHELAHFLATRNEPDVVGFEPGPPSREERFAAAFSFSLLMPAALIRRRFADFERENGRFSPRHLIILAHQLAVSEEALCRRLEELHLLRSGTWDSLRERGFSGELVRRVLGDKPPQEDEAVPPRLWLLAGAAYERELLSEGQLARLLHADRREVRLMLDALGLEEWDGFKSFQAE